MNTNYIASAGTGKTFNLVEQVINKIKKGVSLDNMLILTFTEKAAGEIKEKIYTSISQIVEKEDNPELKKRLHSQLLKVEFSYIGTFHSVFLRILKKHPEKSGIDRNTKIFQDSMLRQFLLKEFENWIEDDFNKNRQIWDRLESFSGSNLFEIFYTLYINRTKIKRKKIDIKSQEDKILHIKKELHRLFEELFKKYGRLFLKIKQKGVEEKIFNNNPFELKISIEEGEILQINQKSDRGFIFKGSRSGNKESREFFLKSIQPYLDENFFELDNKIFDLSRDLYQEQLDFNANLIIDRFLEFLSYIEKIKRIEGVIDFDDILIKMNKLLKDNHIRKNLKEKFRYIFVDEFQDTDRLQIQILKKLADNNISVFGDPKQCIYQWRAADLQGYFQFVDGFKKVILEKNYRSCPEIVEFLNRIFTSEKILTHINDEYKKAVKPVKKKKGEVKIKDISDAGIDQTDYIPLLIQQLSKNYSYSQIMILARTNNILKKIVQSLQKNNIPVRFHGAGNLFETEEVKTVINILRFIEDPENPVNMIKVLKSPLVMEDERQIYRSKTEIKKYNNPFLSLLLELSKQKFSIPPAKIIDRIYIESDIIPIFSSFEDGKTKLRNLSYLQDLILRLSRENYNLRDIILYAETASEKIPDDDQQNCVEVLTIHKSKGLQKEVVILPFFDTDPYTIKHRNIYFYKDELIINFKNAKSKEFFNVEKDLYLEDQNEIERLLYVALTRAEEKLYIIKSKKPSKNSFLKLLENASDLSPYIHKIIKIEKRLDVSASEKKPSQPLDEAVQLEKFLKKEKEKASKFERFTTVTKLTEKKKKLSKNSQNAKISMFTGIVIHSVLEEMDFKDFSLEKSILKIREKIDTVPQKIKKEVEEKAVELMKIFENSEILDELKKSSIIFKEVPFILKEKDRFVEGRIDIVYKKDGEINVMDYKTADFTSEKEIVDRYNIQKKYYLKAVKKIFPEKKVSFKIGMLSTGKIIKLN